MRQLDLEPRRLGLKGGAWVNRAVLARLRAALR